MNISCPIGMSGLACEPWARGEVYAVAANWSQASSPVMVYGMSAGDWSPDERGRQVADFRHRKADALESIIREAIEAGGDTPDDDDVAAMLDDAVDVHAGPLADMIATLERHGERFTGVDVVESAHEWLDNGFAADEANPWCEAGVWNSDVAAELRAAGLDADKALAASRGLLEYLDDGVAAEEFTDSDPIYSVCNGDTPVSVLIASASWE